MTWKIGRVKKLIDCLEKLEVSDEQVFNLRKFKEFNFHSCSTTACALGWFLIKNPKEFSVDPSQNGGNFPFSEAINYFINDPTYQDVELFESVFGINIIDSLKLYKKYRLSEVTKDQVVFNLKRITERETVF